MKEFVIQRYRADTSSGTGRQTLLRIDDEGKVLFADNNAEAVLGYDASELEGVMVHRFLASREDDPFAPANRHRIESGQTVLVTFRHKEGFFYTASLSLRISMRDSDGAASARIAQQENSAIDTRLLRFSESAAGFGIWELDVTSNQMTWTEGLYRLLELKPGTEITPEQALFYCKSGQERVRALFRRCARTGAPFTIELHLLTAKEKNIRATLSGRALKTGGRVRKLGGTLVDRTGEMQRDLACARAENILNATSAASPGLIAAVDKNLNLLHFNAPYARLFGSIFGATPKVGDNLRQLLEKHPNERHLAEQLWHRAFEQDSFIVDMPVTQQSGEWPVYEFHYQRLTNSKIGDSGAEKSETAGAVVVASDISNRASKTGDSEYRYRHDPVTGLTNRREFVARLQRQVEQAGDDAVDSCLLYLNLDSFGHFNNIAGNGACDRYLRELASILDVRSRPQDTVSRLAGDTFALLIEDCTESAARKLADNLLNLIRDFVFEWQGHQLQTTASGGLLIMGKDTYPNPEQLLGQAADLCHDAKTSGRNRIHTGHASRPESDHNDSNELVDRIRKALDRQALILEFQPLKPVASVTWGDHIEILARIPGNSAHEQWLQPDQFLPVAERFDLAKRLDRQVILQTFTWLGEHRLLEPRLKYCGFNLSLASVLDDTFADFMESVLGASNYPAESFCLEICEAHATQYPDEVAVLCDALHRIGCRVALDGAGASVESYRLAAKLPIDVIKLDRSLMLRLGADPVQQVMVEALHRIAQDAGKITVATFIENDDILRKVRTLGIHFGQGFRLGPPKPLAELKPVAVDLPTGRIGG
ncbi:EAL domain-containing protein [Marinobacter sp. DY40_1A1]|uniref:EAL domain-containing protein n=1 Tax=Marinobacter sp. DY40_1A1 TaxID=2583229 RepID=UPI0019068190|nr:EAL domain-containing protein [Marinobacter sp. DY40_1A1]MBK1887982.1 EAL domain-containing protein [Marinobacter sp. DY40_1A1]